MATLGDSLSSCIGKSWSTWGDCMKNKQTIDVGSNSDEQKPKAESDSMKLRSEDMALYGFCPAQDEFFLVVCERCGQVIKPQALQRHIELRHEQKSAKKSKSPISSHKSSQAHSKSSKHGPTKHEEALSVISHDIDLSSDKNRKNHGLPFVKVERMSSDKISKKSSVVEPKYDKPKLSFKETYKEHKVKASVDISHEPAVSQQTVGFVSIKQEKPELHNTNTLDIIVKQEPVFDGISSDYKEEPGGGSKLENSLGRPEPIIINNNPGISEIKSELGVKKEKEVDHRSVQSLSQAQIVPECIEELTCTAEPPVPQMVEETACAVEAINSQDLVDKLFGKRESQVDEIPSKIKVQEETRHVFEIDNRSSTPILHIPSPKSEPPLVLLDSPPLVQTPTPQPLFIINSSGSSSKPNSRPPSRTHSRPPSRQPSQPSTPLTKTETIILDSYDVASQLSRLNSLQESGSSSSSIEKAAISMSTTGSPAISPLVPPQKTFFSSSGVPFKEKCIPCKDRVYDPERHCGTWIVDQSRHCTRSLTCKTHALSVRRAVQGRSKSFDQLLFEHRSAKEAEALRKAKASAGVSGESTTKGLSRIAMATKTLTTTTTTTVMSNCYTKIGKQNSQPSLAVKQPTSNVLSYSHTPKPAVFPVLNRSRPLPLPIPLGGHVTSEGEEEEDADSPGYPCLQHHPRPAAVNSWGSRQYGRGCYIFNQRCDLLRSAFSSVVDVHNQSPPGPPHKKLCLDPKFVQTGGTQDPYDFSFGESHSNGIQIQSSPAMSVHGNLMAKHKSKVPVNLLHKSVKHKETIVESRVSSSSKPSVSRHHGSSSSSSSNSKTGLSSSLKRKRSGGSGVAVTQTTTAQISSVSMPTFSSPLSITIPAGINLATLNNATLHNTLKAHGKNSLNFVVSNTGDPNSGTFTNGQLLNIPAGINLDMAQLTQLGSLTQATVSAGNGVVGSTSDGKATLQKVAAKGTAKLIPTMQNRTLAQKAQPFQIDFGNGSTGSVMAALQTGTVVMDTGQTQGTFLTSSQVALPTATAISMANHPHQSTATGIVLKKDGQLANGVLPHGGNLQQKGLPLSINHLASSDPSQTNATAITQITLASKQQGRNNSLAGSKVSHFPKNMRATLKPAVTTLKPAVSSHHHHVPLSRAPHQIAATINLSQQGGGGGRFLTPGNLQQVYTNQVISPLQLQPKGTGAKTTQGTGGPKLLQPMSLTIVAPPGGLAGLGGTQARPLLINSDTNNGKNPLGDVVSSPGSVT